MYLAFSSVNNELLSTNRLWWLWTVLFELGGLTFSSHLSFQTHTSVLGTCVESHPIPVRSGLVQEQHKAPHPQPGGASAMTCDDIWLCHGLLCHIR